ncbi:MAG TPA: CBS domain-containing protein [Candidatus Pullilachnospira intestinigallinarum]|nr:CBS domain-containing protein [Candidatus Pullilachnospira intestinigallinarum]
MNILFFLTPKSEVSLVYNDQTLGQVLDIMENCRYTAVPMLNRNGRYVGTVTEGDLLRFVRQKPSLNLKETEEYQISRVPLRWRYKTVSIDCDMEDLVDVAMNQNFVPVEDDSDNFIGIIRRKDILEYCYKKSRGGHPSAKKEEKGA